MDKLNLEIHDKLKHLSLEQLDSLMLRYYGNETAKSLIEEYQIDISSGKLYTIFPPKVCEAELCHNCNIPMVIERKSKTASSQSYRSKDIHQCLKCGHNDGRSCSCDSCTREREIERARKEEAKKRELEYKRELINKHYDLRNNVSVEYSELMFRDKVYLGALLRLCVSEDLQYIKAVASSDDKLSPSPEMSKEIVLSLINKSLITIHPNSPSDAFVESGEEPFPTVYYIYKTNYHLNVGLNEQRERIIKELMNPPEFDRLDNSVFGLMIWKEIALAECLEYLMYQINKVKLSFTPGEKTIALFEDLLDKFSVSQIYGIIYKGVTSATRYYQESNISKKQAGNSVISSCQKYAETALANNWELRSYHRIPDLPQSMISEFFFNRVLKIGDEGFYTVPRKL
jgi:hypothetical protein